MKNKRIGILGAGQLGRMLAEAAQGLGLECRFLDPATEVSARGLGQQINAAFEDVDALDELQRGIDAITYEFENVPVESIRWLEQRVPVAPCSNALRVAQDRLFEKSFFTKHSIPVPTFRDFFFRDEFDEALEEIGLPCVMKTRRFGYDGKGQRMLRTADDAERAWKELNGLPLFLEGFVPFQREVSLLAVRFRSGEFRFYPLVENHHRDGILRLSIAPAPDLAAGLQEKAEGHARRIMEALDYVGVLAIEFFLLDSDLYANEMAPRVHNSGHWSIEGAASSQFENHLRALMDMTPGDTTLRGVSAMVNHVGHLPPAVSQYPGARHHDYGKKPRPGRKVAHTTFVEDSMDSLLARLGNFATVTDDQALKEILAKRFC